MTKYTLMSLAPNQQQFDFEHSFFRTWKINLDEFGSTQSSIHKALNDGIEEIDAIHSKTQIEIYILLATLLELEFTGTVENIRDQMPSSCYRAGH